MILVGSVRRIILVFLRIFFACCISAIWAALLVRIIIFDYLLFDALIIAQTEGQVAAVEMLAVAQARSIAIIAAALGDGKNANEAAKLAIAREVCGY
jgi:hypothetical protein